MKIDKNVLMFPKRVFAPKKRQTHQYVIPHSVFAAQVRNLEVGDSFFVKTSNHNQTIELQRRLAGAIGGSYIKSNVLWGKRFAIRQMFNGVRVWRKI